MNNSYDIFIAYAALLFANMVVGILYLFAGGDSGQTFGLALIYWALYTPLSFICWFRPAYKAFRDDSSFNFMVSKMFMTQRCQAYNNSAITNRNGCSFISLPKSFERIKSGYRQMEKNNSLQLDCNSTELILETGLIMKTKKYVWIEKL